MRYAAVPAAANAADAIAARGAHRWHFSEEESTGLRTALPQMEWQRAGDEWTLPHGDFEGLVYAFGIREADPTFAGAFHSGVLNETLVDRSWQEVCRFMQAADWTRTEYGVMLERLYVASHRTGIDRARLCVFSGSDGSIVEAAPASTMTADQLIAAGLTAEAEGAPFARPAWLDHVLFVDGKLCSGVQLTPAIEFAYYTETRASADHTLLGSPFAMAITEITNASVVHTVKATGLAGATIRARPTRVLAAMMLEFVSDATWPALLHVYAAPGIPRSLDLGAKHAYLRSGGEGSVAQNIVIHRLPAMLRAAAGSTSNKLAPLAAAHHGFAATSMLISEHRRLQGILGVTDPNTILLSSLEASSRRLKGLHTLLLSPEMAGLGHEDRITQLETIAGNGPGLGLTSPGGISSGGGFGVAAVEARPLMGLYVAPPAYIPSVFVTLSSRPPFSTPFATRVLLLPTSNRQRGFASCSAGGRGERRTSTRAGCTALPRRPILHSSSRTCSWCLTKLRPFTTSTRLWALSSGCETACHASSGRWLRPRSWPASPRGKC